MMSSRTPEVVSHAGPVLANFDVLLCDVWGVLHGGDRIFPQALDALYAFGRQGGTVVLVSNAPTPGDAVATFLEARGLPRDSWHAIVTSGSLALAEIQQRNFRKLYQIGPTARDHGFFARLPGQADTLASADAIACTGLVDDVNETVEEYRSLLSEGVARNLPFVCANPDLVVDVSGKLYVCAGALAETYQALGGSVIWCGKPHPSAYATAIAKACDIRNEAVPRARIIGVGDAVRTDMAAARNAGVAGLLVASGIHRHEVMPEGTIVPATLAAICSAADVTPRAAIDWFRW